MRTPSTGATRKRRKGFFAPPAEQSQLPTLDSREVSVRPSTGTRGAKQRDDGSHEEPDESEKDGSGHQSHFARKAEAEVEGHFEIESRGGKRKSEIFTTEEIFATEESSAKVSCFKEDGFTRETSENKRMRKEGKNRFRSLALSCMFLGLLFGHWWLGRAEALAGGQKYSTRVVRTRYGTLRGIVARTTAVEVYCGVPYATPPLGSLRYMPPVTPTPWRGTKLADTMPPVCPQKPPKPDPKLPRSRRLYLEKIAPILANQSEDCLYLNLYVPRPPHVSGGMIPSVRPILIRTPRPYSIREGCYVTVYIHGRGVLAGHLREQTLEYHVGAEDVFSVHISGHDDLVAPLRIISENHREPNEVDRYFIKVSNGVYTTYLSATLGGEFRNAQARVSIATQIPQFGYIATLHGGLHHYHSTVSVPNWAS